MFDNDCIYYVQVNHNIDVFETHQTSKNVWIIYFEIHNKINHDKHDLLMYEAAIQCLKLYTQHVSKKDFQFISFMDLWPWKGVKAIKSVTNWKSYTPEIF